MFPELAQFALILALCLALVQALLPLAGAHWNVPAWMAVAGPAALGQCLLQLFAFGVLIASLIRLDLSLAYVAHNANSQLPQIYRIAAAWGGHEGSLLLWTLLLALWAVALARFSRAMPAALRARVLGTLGAVSSGMLLFLLFTSNPFARLIPPPLEGQDLNPLLQDPGLVLHPPMLYLGYVGLAVPFGFAIAALLGGRLDAAWARWVRPWTNLAWLFLTLGIVLGSWWAYYELGWGGWWFWDPVENAALMPWLVATALVHSLAVSDKRGGFKAWTVLLAILAFALALLGTFVVRSGVLSSVHAFAADPGRGVFVLWLLVIVVGCSLSLFAARGAGLRSGVRFGPLSREGALLGNNLLLLALAASVLLGTLYPLALDALGLGRISVGPPYFNLVFVPLAVALAALLGLGVALRWRSDSALRLTRELRPPLALTVGGALVTSLVASAHGLAVTIGAACALWLFAVTAQGLWRRRGRITPAYAGMAVGHFGLAVFAAGLTASALFSVGRDVALAPGSPQRLGGYAFQLLGSGSLDGPNYSAREARIEVRADSGAVLTLHPQKRIYLNGAMPMTEAAIDAGLWRDLYVALGEPLDEAGAWSVRLAVKPLMRWVWFGGLLMAFGALLAVFDRRYRRGRG